MKPFDESSRFEQGNFSNSFYATGSQSSLGEMPGSFSRSLMSKEQVKLSLSVNVKTQMLPNTSSIYYYNTKNKTWNIPSNSESDHVGPFNKFSYNTKGWLPGSGTIDPYRGTPGTAVTEDAKCFNAYGQSIASGSLEIFRSSASEQSPLIPSNQFISNQTIEVIGQEAPKPDFLIEYLTKDYPQSVQRSDLYDASSEELIDFGIQYPFLLEKAVFEVPVTAGSTWLDDRTVTSFSLASGTYNSTSPMPKIPYIDSGGPCVTLSLFCQKKYGTSYIRDLVLSGTITNRTDTISSFLPRVYGLKAEGDVPVVLIEPLGMSDPGGIIAGENTFTGSVVIKTQPAISNGVNGLIAGVFFVIDVDEATFLSFPSFPGLENAFFNTQRFLSHMERLSSKKTVEIKEIAGYPINLITSDFFTVTSLDAFGRAMTGFSPSGGSIFGSEYTSPQRTLQKDFQDNATVNNPLYSPDQHIIVQTIQQLSATLDTAYKSGTGSPYAVSYVQLIYQSNFYGSVKPSPYLINPGDKFVLAMSKTRPAISASGHNVPDSSSADTGFQTLTRQINITGSIAGHDFFLSTGSINITLYGSYVRAGNSYVP